MRVAIVGAGVAGSYLYKSLQNAGVYADIYDKPKNTSCGQSPCGWLVSYQEFAKLSQVLGIDFRDYILGRFTFMEVQGKRLPADTATIDKPRLIRDLLAGTVVRYDMPDVNEYDRIIDATAKRVYLSSGEFNHTVAIHQVRYRNNGDSCDIPVGVIGHGQSLEYLIPLGDGTTHAGYGSISGTTAEEIKRLIAGKSVLCSCVGHLWVGGPMFPVVEGRFVGVGESIGLVDPLSGMGITPAMDSARALAQYWRNLNGYENYIMSKYHYMVRRSKAMSTQSMFRKAPELILSYREGARLTGFKVGSMGIFKLLGHAHKVSI